MRSVSASSGSPLPSTISNVTLLSSTVSWSWTSVVPWLATAPVEGDRTSLLAEERRQLRFVREVCALTTKRTDRGTPTEAGQT